ncbi:internal mitochondrial NADH dehydrogenase (ubiquinone) Ndi1 [Schizosaccharomyces osmophilus]|uniref:Internal mitochondrial NADH dehydrogenase (Ubiquinone) Ndi1 n=1 Tax=Schizosaccharomyces osmophilus TaxID=2545709 RepID=A0AAE9W776_9SCHI|nr:internal mitochondrial NADH dehydrogenase (ubiquinone) Ndi1 [Schizosaccharomyces osmophilus]WBW71175.1 internal mitochondrial NADH dehydrogenase (ubiquinone) Ndi1 [Schizosaccharomyces osmophilus]
MASSLRLRPQSALKLARASGWQKNAILLRRSFQSSTAIRANEKAPMQRSSLGSRLCEVMEVASSLSLLTGVAVLQSLRGVVASSNTVAAVGSPKRTLVVLGSGWGAISILKNIDTSLYNVIVVSPRDHFLFTPMLPSCTVGTLRLTSITEPLVSLLQDKLPPTAIHQAECSSIDSKGKKLVIRGTTPANKDVETELPYDDLVVAVGATNQFFGLQGVKQHGCFLKEAEDAKKVFTKVSNTLEQVRFNKTLTPEDRSRLLHFTVVGGGPTGMEFAAEMRDYIDSDIRTMFPELYKEVRITLIEAAPKVLPMFTKQLVQYTEGLFKDIRINIMTQALVKDVNEKELVIQKTNADGSKTIENIPYGLLVWAAGITARDLTRQLMSTIPEQSGARRGLMIDEFFRVKGMPDTYAIGDCAFSGLPATAQVAHQQGDWLAANLNKSGKANALKHRIEVMEKQLGEKKTDQEFSVLKKELANTQLQAFQYNHQGAMAYVGHDKAIADLKVPYFNKILPLHGNWGNTFWRLAYLNQLVSGRSQFLVLFDWLKARLFGRFDAKV